jgi:chromosome segregation ATPase
MKKIFITALICFGLSGWVAVIYQHNLQKGVEAKIKDSVIRELEGKKEIEESIRQERESSEKANEFVSRREYEARLGGSLKQALADYRKENSDYQKNMDASFEELLSSSEERISGQSQILEIYKNQLEGFKKEQADSMEKAKELEARFADTVNTIEKMKGNQSEYEQQLKDYNNQLEELKARQDTYDKQSAENRSKLEDLSGRIDELRK